jgi:thioesterase domain-containing protein
LDTEQPLYALEHQSQDGQPARYTRVETIAAHYLEQIRSVQPHGPYFLGGYSFGGILAFEIAQRLSRDGEEIRLLFMIDSHFPGPSRVERPRQDSSQGQPSTAGVGHGVLRHLRNVSSLTAEERVRYVRIRAAEKLRDRFQRASRDVKIWLCKMYLPVTDTVPSWLRSQYILNIYYQAVKRYEPPRYPGHLVYVRSEQRAPVHGSRWQDIAESFELHEVPGADHTTIIGEPYASLWVETLTTCLRTAQDTLTSNGR